MATSVNQTTKSSTKILSCNCNLGNGAEYQDKVYGKQKRLHNPSNKGYRCTVCGSLKPS